MNLIFKIIFIQLNISACLKALLEASHFLFHPMAIISTRLTFDITFDWGFTETYPNKFKTYNSKNQSIDINSSKRAMRLQGLTREIDNASDDLLELIEFLKLFEQPIATIQVCNSMQIFFYQF